MIIYHGMSIVFLAVLVLVVGLIKPKWIFIWMDNPGRLPVTALAMILFMIGMVLFGEGNKQKQQEKQAEAQVQTAVPQPPAPQK